MELEESNSEETNLTAMPCLCCAAPYVEMKEILEKEKLTGKIKTFFIGR